MISPGVANSSRMLKLRASYAVVSEPADHTPFPQYYSVGSAIKGTTTGSFSSTLPNLFLKPYTLSEFEIELGEVLQKIDWVFRRTTY
jgi:hypothetical protein